MSVSKLESLPNEILVEILEKYINGIDIINSFAFQLNRRFNALITQSQRLRFDFIRCHKDDFRRCMGLLPAYVDKIEQLALAERYTPGQVHAFLTFYPSFAVFKHLRKLYFHIDTNAVDSRMLSNVLHSLLSTSLHTFSFDISGSFTFNNILTDLFRMKTLKKLFLRCDNVRVSWEQLKTISSNIEVLTIHGIICLPEDLAHILRCAPTLRYLDINMQFVIYFSTCEMNSSANNDLPRMSMLHTLIITFVDNDQTMFGQLEMYFRRMPSLHRLEIRTQNGIWSVPSWETLIQSSLSSLTSFILEETTALLTQKDISLVLESTKTSFWTNKRHFHVIIKESTSSKNEWKETTSRWFIAPQRKSENDSSVLNNISKLRLSAQAHSLSSNYYLNNVLRLVVADLKEDLLRLLTTYVNCSRIKYLDVSSIGAENNIIPILLSSINNIRSLRIHLDRLYEKPFTDRKKGYDHIRHLDISTNEHRFSKQDIQTISTIFPHLEQLSIYTNYLENVPLLQTYLPHLRTLTFRMLELTNTYSYNNHEQKLIDSILRKDVQFHFQRQDSWITVWIDQAAFQDPYWRINGSMDTSGKPNDRSRLKRIIDEMYFDWN